MSTTIKSLNKQNPEQYVMVTYEFNTPVFIAPLREGDINITDNVEEAEKWSYADLTHSKLGFHKRATGYKHLKWEVIK